VGSVVEKDLNSFSRRFLSGTKLDVVDDEAECSDIEGEAREAVSSLRFVRSDMF